MKALVYHGPGQRTLEEAPKPVIQMPGDAIVRVTKSTICGTDLHILKGDVPSVTDGRILGHEGVGIVEEVGEGVSAFKPGDPVLISCITSCGTCANCKKGSLSHCLNGGGWILGNTIDGTQAEYVRIPYADTSLHPMPPGVDDEVLVMLSDILPTSFEIGVLNGNVKPGDVVAIIGAGPVGMAAVLTSQFYTPSSIIVIDIDENRLALARKLGAAETVNSAKPDAAGRVLALTDGRGVDVAIEAVGIPATLELAQEIVAIGGHIANIGVHGTPVPLHMETLWARNITLTTGLVDTRTTPLLLKLMAAGKFDPKALITHHFTLDEVEKAYDVFGNAAKEGAMKVIIAS